MIRRFLQWMEGGPQNRIGLRILQVCIGLLLIYRVATEGPFAGYLWGPDGIGTGHVNYRFGQTIASATDLLFESNLGVHFVLLLILLGATAYLAGVWTWTATLVLVFTFPALGDRNIYLLDGGDVLTNLALMFMLLVLPQRTRRDPGRERIWLHNIGVNAITIQLMIVYAVSGFWKAGGKLWMQGTALYSISQVTEFSQPELQALFWNGFLVTLLTYGTIIFQLWFPIAILSPLKLPWLLGGLVLHVGIAASMGLITFSLVMMGLDLFLITDDEYKRMRARASEVIGRIRSRYTPRTDPRRGESPGG